MILHLKKHLSNLSQQLQQLLFGEIKILYQYPSLPVICAFCINGTEMSAQRKVMYHRQRDEDNDDDEPLPWERG